MPYKDPEKSRIAARQRVARYRLRHPERARAAVRKYEATNKAVLLPKRRKYKADHPEQIQASFAAWAKANPEKAHARTVRRRARLSSALINDFTAAQWVEMKIAYGYHCVYCGRKMKRLTMDHITPLSKGGSHTASNILPACMGCNTRKSNRSVLRPVQPVLLLVAPSRIKSKQ